MKRVVLGLLGFVASSFSYEPCQATVSIEQASQIGKQYVGDVYSVRLAKSKKTEECYYQVRGKEGTATIDAKSGKLVRFYRSRN